MSSNPGVGHLTEEGLNQLRISNPSDSGNKSPRWSPFEKQCLKVLEDDDEGSSQYNSDESDQVDTRCENLWEGFESTAHSLTQLYQESIDSFRRGMETGMRMGRKKQTKELVAFLKKYQRRYVFREDLIGFLCGKTPPFRSGGGTGREREDCGGVPLPSQESPERQFVASNQCSSSAANNRKAHTSPTTDLSSFFSTELEKHSTLKRKRPLFTMLDFEATEESSDRELVPPRKKHRVPR